MVHAGVLPQWDAAQTLALAQELEHELRGPDWGVFLHNMYGNVPDQWDEGLRGMDRLRVIVNALTRLRFCSADGVMEFETKEQCGISPCRLHALVRGARPSQRRHRHRLRPLVDPGRCRSQRSAGAGHGLCVGWLPDGGEAGRQRHR